MLDEEPAFVFCKLNSLYVLRIREDEEIFMAYDIPGFYPISGFSFCENRLFVVSHSARLILNISENQLVLNESESNVFKQSLHIKSLADDEEDEESSQTLTAASIIGFSLSSQTASRIFVVSKFNGISDKMSYSTIPNPLFCLGKLQYSKMVPRDYKDLQFLLSDVDDESIKSTIESSIHEYQQTYLSSLYESFDLTIAQCIYIQNFILQIDNSLVKSAIVKYFLFHLSSLIKDSSIMIPGCNYDSLTAKCSILDHRAESNSYCENCPACNEPIQFSLFDSQSKCANGHVWDRDGISGQLLTSPFIYKCFFCSSKYNFLLPFYSGCIFCANRLVQTNKF